MSKINSLVLFIALLFLATLFLLVCLNSCTVTKAKSSHSADSSHVQKVDSGAIKQIANSTKSDSQYSKEIIYFGKDTVTNNYYTTPAVIYRETGAASKQEDKLNTEANWNKSIDSTQTKVADTAKNKEEKALSFWQIIALVGGGIVLMKLLPDFKITLK